MELILLKVVFYTNINIRVKRDIMDTVYWIESLQGIIYQPKLYLCIFAYKRPSMKSVYKYIHVDRWIDIGMSKDKDIHIDMGLCGQILLVLLFDNIYILS